MKPSSMKAGNEGVKSRYPVGKVFSYFPVLQELLVLQQWGRPRLECTLWVPTFVSH